MLLECLSNRTPSLLNYNFLHYSLGLSVTCIDKSPIFRSQEIIASLFTQHGELALKEKQTELQNRFGSEVALSKTAVVGFPTLP